jgi:putative serine protease PepD
MVAQQFFDEHGAGEGSGSAAAPPGNPPPRRFRARVVAGVTALAIAGGAGAGAVTTTILGHGNQATTSNQTASSTTSTSNTTPASAEGIYQQVSPGVVTITTVVAGPFGRSGEGTGSGIVLDSKGDILTNYHVIANADQVQVKFSDGTTANATVVGTNSGYDLAVIRVSVAASKLHPVTLGNYDSVRIGDTVYAIGSPFGLSGSLTEGIVSNLHQSSSSVTSSSRAGSQLNNLIQTDTPINPGNSGGALVNAAGQVIGITQSIESPVEGNVGVGFAIPINQVTQLLSSIEGGSNV